MLIPDNSKFKLKIFKGISGLNEISCDWKKITDSLERKQLWHLYDFYRSYVLTLEEDPEKIFFFVFYNNDEAQAIIPLKMMTRSILGIRMKVFILAGSPHNFYYDYILNNLNQSQEYLSILLDELDNFPDMFWNFIYFPRIYENSNTKYSLNSLTGIYMFGKKEDQCDFLELKSYPQMLEQLSRNSRKILRKRKKRLSELDAVSFYTTNTLPELEDAYQVFLDVEASGWKGREGSAVKLNNRMNSFFKSLMYSFAQSGECEINLMKHGDKTIAVEFVVMVNDTCYALRIGYDETYGEYSPGNMMTDYCIQRYIKNDFAKYFNFCSDEYNNKRWKPKSISVYDYYIFKRNIKGMFAFVIIKMEYFIRPFYQSHIKPAVKHILGRKYGIITNIRDRFGLSHI